MRRARSSSREIGGAELFWGDRAVAGQRGAQLLRVRSLVDGFEKRIGEIEERRQEVLEAVLRQQDDTDWLEDDVLEAEEEERAALAGVDRRARDRASSRSARW